MLRLFLLRHAKSSPGESGRPDFDRHLIPRGRRAAARIGEYLADKQLLPDLVLCSSSRRTRETLAALLPFIDNDALIRISAGLYESTVDAYLAAIRTWGGKAKMLLVIGHNPAIEECAADLLSKNRSGGSPAIRFPTAGLAVIDFDIPQWDGLRPGTGRLAGFVQPRGLALGIVDSDPVAT